MIDLFQRLIVKMYEISISGPLQAFALYFGIGTLGTGLAILLIFLSGGMN